MHTSAIRAYVLHAAAVSSRRSRVLTSGRKKFKVRTNRALQCVIVAVYKNKVIYNNKVGLKHDNKGSVLNTDS